MTEQEKKEYETRKKIASTLLHANEIMEGHGFVFCLKLADILIAEGIGFNKSHLKTFQELDTKLRVAEHRAEVAEKALREACSRAWSIECACPSIFEDNDECSECYKNQSEKRYEEKDAIGCLSKKLLKQAEKELQEERKDD